MMVMDSLDSRLSAMATASVNANIITKDDIPDIKKAAKSFYQKLTIADAYKPASKLDRVKVHLIRASQSHTETGGIGDDYGLGTICSEPVTIDVVEGAHNTFILGDGATRIQEILNQTLQA